MDHQTAGDIKGHFDSVAGGLRLEIQDVKGHSDVIAKGLRSEIQGLRSEFQDVKRHSDVIAESLRGEIRLVAEGVAGVNEKFTPEFVTVREEIREQIGEVTTLIRVSYGDRDRPVQTLERKSS